MREITKRLAVSALMAAAVTAFTVFGASQGTILTVGVVAGSYWDAPTGNCYAVIDAAIERFERARRHLLVPGGQRSARGVYQRHLGAGLF